METNTNTTPEENIINFSFSIKNPSIRIFSFVGLVALSLFIYGQFIYFLGPSFEEIGRIKNINIVFIMKYMWTIIIAYFLIDLWLILLTLIIKGTIKKFGNEGLLSIPVGGFIFGSLLGLLTGVGGLVLGFFFGFLFGLIHEFKK